MRRLICFLAAFLVVALPLLAAAFSATQCPSPNLSGQWTLNASGLLPDGEMPCTFQGNGNMVQDGNHLFGQADLMLVSGPPACPAEMSANLDGMLDGSSFMGTLDGGAMFGVLAFSGMIGPDCRSLEGTYSVSSGPFMGVTGTWSSALANGFLIPVLDGVGLFLLAGLLAYAGVILLRRRTA